MTIGAPWSSLSLNLRPDTSSRLQFLAVQVQLPITEIILKCWWTKTSSFVSPPSPENQPSPDCLPRSLPGLLPRERVRLWSTAPCLCAMPRVEAKPDLEALSPSAHHPQSPGCSRKLRVWTLNCFPRNFAGLLSLARLGKMCGQHWGNRTVDPRCPTWQFALNLQDQHWRQTYRFSSFIVLHKADGQWIDLFKKQPEKSLHFNLQRKKTWSIFVCFKMSIGWRPPCQQQKQTWLTSEFMQIGIYTTWLHHFRLYKHSREFWVMLLLHRCHFHLPPEDLFFISNKPMLKVCAGGKELVSSEDSFCELILLLCGATEKWQRWFFGNQKLMRQWLVSCHLLDSFFLIIFKNYIDIQHYISFGYTA